MAKIFTEPKGMPKTLRQQMPDFDYSKYENTKQISSRRKEIRAADVERASSTIPKKAFRITVDRNDAAEVPVIVRSDGKLEHPERAKLAQFRNTKSEIKARARGEEMERPRAKSSQERRSPARGAARQSPLQDVRRKLFDDDPNDAAQPDCIDFTDKLAALRSLISKDREETKTIHDRRAYYDEYKSSNKKIMVSRSDSIKENIRNELAGDHIPNKNLDSDRKDERRRKTKDIRRSVQSADIFREHKKGDRLSEKDLELLKSNLLNREKSGQKSADFTTKEINAVSSNHVNSSDAMIHATEGRKIMVSSRSNRSRHTEKKIDHIESRPESRNDAKEAQTNSSFLNHSLRSVQSNVPFYEPGGTPLSRTPAVREQRKNLDQVQGNVPEGIDQGVNISSRVLQSPDRPTKLQSNVDTYVGTSLTPEKEKRKSEQVCNGIKDMEEGKTSAPKRSKRQDRLFAEVKKLSLQVSHRGSSRPSSRIRTSSRAENSSENEDMCRNDSNSNHRKHERFRSKSSMDYDRNFNINIDQDFTNRTSKSDRKVREWIEKQKVLNNKDNLVEDKEMIIEEFSIDVCFSARSPNNDCALSPTNSCDKVPVKLEKSHRVRPGSAPVFNKNAGSRRVYGEGRAPSRSNINTRLDQISNAALSEHNRLQQEFGGLDVKSRNNNRQLPENDSTESE